MSSRRGYGREVARRGVTCQRFVQSTGHRGQSKSKEDEKAVRQHPDLVALDTKDCKEVLRALDECK